MSAKELVEVAPGFWNIRGSFKIALGLVNIGNHMSILKLNNGKFLVIDAIPLTDSIKAGIDSLTENGKLIEAVVATHPFHTLAFPGFCAVYPNVPYYGTPRHLRNQPQIPWVGSVDDCAVRKKWSPEVEMRIPAGAEFVAPQPEKYNHFSSVFVFHAASKTFHVDDTIMYAESPGLLLRLAGFKEGSMAFHPTIKNVGLLPNPEAPYQFRDWLAGVINDWDFDNICTAHMGNKIGGAKEQLKHVLAQHEFLFKELSEKRQKNSSHDNENAQHEIIVNDCECG
eukprot:TRINITY_DN8388_c0_g1_i1.p1 TRINITY_DN8388_c0_g1~~TRINITY_DN8388_c0_g1_i1.p1  ORF type:complete len:306 (-),score=54.00 TRINITY_DN8388_c0_g1_i1:77-922(-)